MEQHPVIFEISSDEEPEFGDLEDDDRDWLSRVLGAVDKQMQDGDSDEVVFIGEVNPRTKLESAVKDSGGGGECDDCVVLEGDPDKPPELASDSKEYSDDCLVVAEKGQVACRDFPHPRHDCALFPFSSTPHENHCQLCHCFVCDKRAPCEFWGLGTSSSDHCHGNDKNDTWQLLRKNFRLLINTPVQASRVPNPSPDTALLNKIQAQHSRITQLLSTCRPQQQVARPVVAHSGHMLPQNQLLGSTLRRCSSSTKQGVPSITNQARSRLPGSPWNKNPVQHRPMSQQFVGVRNTVVWKVRGRNGTGSSCVPSSTLSKRVDGRVPPAVKQSTNFSADSIADNGFRHAQNVTPASTPHDRYYNELLELVSGDNPGTCMPQDSLQPNVSTVFTGTVPYQPPVASVPVAQSNTEKIISPSQTESHPVSVNDLNFCWVDDIVQSVQEPVSSTSQCQNFESTDDQLLLANEGNGGSKSIFDEVDLPEFDFEQHVPGDMFMSTGPELWSFDSDVFFFDY